MKLILILLSLLLCFNFLNSQTLFKDYRVDGDYIVSKNEVFFDDTIYAFTNDSLYHLQWNLNFIGLEQLNPVFQNEWKKQAKIYILDSGAPADWDSVITHPDLQGSRFIVGNNYAQVPTIVDFDGDGETDDTIFIKYPHNMNWDDLGHSTHIAGIIGANANNNIGIAGVDWVSEITFVKVLREYGWGKVSWIMKGILDADKESEERQMDIIVNLSLGSVFPFRPLEELIKYLDEKRDRLGYGVILVCAAGNNGVEANGYPAAYSHTGNIKQGYKNVISVGGIVNYELAPYSNYGSDVDIFAPSGSQPELYYSIPDGIYRLNYDSLTIFSLAPDSVIERRFLQREQFPLDHPYNYFRQSGTSMAAPHVTGAICRYLDYWGKGLPIKNILINSARIFDYTVSYEGYSYDFQGRFLYLPSLFRGRKFQDEWMTNYPNPFNPKTNIVYRLEENSFVNLKVYDILGNEVVELVNSFQSIGEHVTPFDASNLASGIYLYRLETNKYSYTSKMIIVK